MEWWVVLAVAFLLLVIFFSLGMPVAFAFFALDICGLYYLFGQKGMALLTTSLYESVATFTLSPIPMFILLGEIFYQSRVVDIAFDAIDKWIGGVRARLHLVTLLFATIFGAISGSAPAMAAVLGTTVLPEMERRGYDKKLSLGVIMGGATLDPLIPPSIVAVMIAGLANVSTAKLLVSGFGPGFLLALLYVGYVLVAVKLNPGLAPPYGASTSIREKLWALCRLMPFGLIIFLIIGLMMLGIAAPTESAATGVIFAIILAAALRRLTFEAIKNSLWGTVRVSAMVLLIIAGSKAFSQILAISGSTRGMVEVVTQAQLSPLALLLLMQLIPLILGCFIDGISIMLITIPVYLPVLRTAGFDPLWFWCLFLMNITIGAITPPFGLILYVLKGAAPNASLQEIYRAAIPFAILAVVGLILVTIFPQIAVWIPNLSAQ